MTNRHLQSATKSIGLFLSPNHDKNSHDSTTKTGLSPRPMIMRILQNVYEQVGPTCEIRVFGLNSMHNTRIIFDLISVEAEMNSLQERRVSCGCFFLEMTNVLILFGKMIRYPVLFVGVRREA